MLKPYIACCVVGRVVFLSSGLIDLHNGTYSTPRAQRDHTKYKIDNREGVGAPPQPLSAPHTAHTVRETRSGARKGRHKNTQRASAEHRAQRGNVGYVNKLRLPWWGGPATSKPRLRLTKCVAISGVGCEATLCAGGVAGGACRRWYAQKHPPSRRGRPTGKSPRLVILHRSPVAAARPLHCMIGTDEGGSCEATLCAGGVAGGAC
eukprot:scaffold26944_cov63-Phaeocystis_antarctica.AAC.4